ncbi:undecaprenyl-diphosphate phosphatase [Paenibacillus sp. y28]|uniref:undecaprenyl-diphosphate phosphatase n=1 Tax=Paenibacillus sp. y28 TaxID=3129110 RepID=UPI003019CF26
MYELWHSIIIGIVEGLTEFLPVSSTGHMILTSDLLGYPHDDVVMQTFEIVIQLGAILAVLILYWKRVLRLFGWRDPSAPPSASGGRMNLLHVLIAIVPAMGIGFFIDDFIEQYLFSPYTVLIGLVLGGIFLIVGEKQQPAVTARDMDDLTYRQALFIGLSQCLALWPGFSRSGATIAGGMLAGVSRAASADFTFLIAIPVMFAASGYKLLKNYEYLSMDYFGFFAVGFVVSFIVALLAVLWFIRLVSRLDLSYFAYYRFIAAGAFLIYILLGKL